MKITTPSFAAILGAIALAAPAFVLADAAAPTPSPTATWGPSSSGHYEHHGHGMFAMLQGLGLSQQQQDQIQTLIQNFKTAHPEGSQPDPAARKQLRDQIFAVLTPAQKAKLETEIQQWHGQHNGRGNPAPTPTP